MPYLTPLTYEAMMHEDDFLDSRYEELYYYEDEEDEYNDEDEPEYDFY